MLRTLTAAAALGLALATAAPATAAVDVFCFSDDVDCQGYQCPEGFHAIFDNGAPDTGPWLVVCAPDV